jgi:hypothetical protein
MLKNKLKNQEHIYAPESKNIASIEIVHITINEPMIHMISYIFGQFLRSFLALTGCSAKKFP